MRMLVERLESRGGGFKSLHQLRCLLSLARLRNHDATDDGKIDLRSFKKFNIQSLENE